ncbi:hypothetical protein chiPu_0019084 [Chiloscyllium punctatum]|uniref:Uncharacterized protein n=1 Tax=Chiloscyllium punctatum TaxID=137246 RepID=A0A401RQU1_CHIPU|nr:hypothetical protein [Chiloscyllium punctatum]
METSCEKAAGRAGKRQAALVSLERLAGWDATHSKQRLNRAAMNWETGECVEVAPVAEFRVTGSNQEPLRNMRRGAAQEHSALTAQGVRNHLTESTW